MAQHRQVRGIVLMHLFSRKDDVDSDATDRILNFYKLQRHKVRNKSSYSGEHTWLNGPVGWDPPSRHLAVGEGDAVFNMTRWKIMSLISRFPEGGLFYGPVMSRALVNATRAMNDLSKVDEGLYILNPSTINNSEKALFSSLFPYFKKLLIDSLI